MHREVAVNATRSSELGLIIGSVTTRLLTVEDLTAAAQAIVDQVSHALNADIAFLASVDEAGQRLNYLASTGLPQDFIEVRRSLPMDAPIVVARAARTRQVQEVEELATLGDEFSLSRKLSSLGARSMLALPLLARKELVGVLAIARAQPGLVSAPERAALEEVAVACALGLNHARALELARSAQAETSRRLANLERQHRLLEVVLAQAPSGIVAFDAPRGEVMFSNEAARRLFGGPVVTNQKVACLCQPDGSPCPPDERPATRALAGESVNDRELQLTRPDGRRVPVSVNAAPVQLDGDTFGAVMVMRDLTAEKELERLRDEFAAVIAHDLRNPIQVVLLQIHLLLRATDAKDILAPRRALERIQGAALRLARMVNDLLDATRIDVSRLVLNRKPIAVAEAVEKLVDQIRPVLAEHPVTVTVEGETNKALLDPVRFDQVLANLLENAAKYSPGAAPIRVHVCPGAGGVVIQIEDEGIGFSPADLPRLFSRFFQARRTREHQSGLGLGLHITRGLVEAHGGHISVASVLGHGSTFRLWFPAHAEPAP